MSGIGRVPRHGRAGKHSASDIMALEPDGIFLSNGPGDPAATGAYAVAQIMRWWRAVCRFSAYASAIKCWRLALGAQTQKMKQGHHGANHPVKDVETGKVEITSMNHGFTVDRETLPDTVVETHISLFDGTNCGIRLKDRRYFPCNTIRKPRRARRTVTIFSTALQQQWSSNGKAHRYFKHMIIGAGPIVIGQACEFDYSGTQACKACAKKAIASYWSIRTPPPS